MYHFGHIKTEQQRTVGLSVTHRHTITQIQNLSLKKRSDVIGLSAFYGNNKRRSAIVRDNRHYLARNIQPSDEFIDSLFSSDCITEKQRHFFQRQLSDYDKNTELSYILSSFDEAKFSNFVKCLKQTNQKTVAKIMENGGGLQFKLVSIVSRLTQ